MNSLTDHELETIVGGQSLAEYALIASIMPKVAENNPNAFPGVNDKAFRGILIGSIHKLLNTL